MLFAQKHTLNFYTTDTIIKINSIEVKDTMSIKEELAILQSSYHIKGFWEFSYDSIYTDSIITKVWIHVGRIYKWGYLKSGNVPEPFLYRSGYKQKFYANTKFSPKQLYRLERELIKYSENQGYPFASVFLDSLRIIDNKVYGILNYASGPLIVYDTIAIEGTAQIKRAFLASCIGVNKGSVYVHKKSLAIEKQLVQLPYLKVTKSPYVYFEKGKAYPVIFINQRKCNQIDGIIGMQQSTGAVKKNIITGEFNLDLKNVFRSGKQVKFLWRRYDVLSQQLNARYVHPRLLRANLDIDLGLDLVKQDSSFLNVNRKLGLITSISPIQKLKLKTELKTSRSLLVATSSNPLVVDFNIYTYGFGYLLNTLDDIFFPMKGWHITFDSDFGLKEIQNTSKYESYLQNHNQSSWQNTSEMMVLKYTKLFKRSTLLTKSITSITTGNNIVVGDMTRVGGLKSLRGFNENFYYVTHYSLLTLEYRYFLESNSYFMLFYDQAYIYNQVQNHYTDFPLGVGAGISFTTKAGLFQLVYAIGKSKDQDFKFNLSKIHFGLITRF
jgi:outer membrane translocation and assembly module TamA